MGYPMAEHLLAHQSIAVYNRTQAKADPLVAKGAYLTNSPRETAEVSEIIFIMVSDDKALTDVMRGPNGVLSGLKTGTVIVDHSTVSVQLTRQLASEAREKGADWCDAPVTGGDIGARNATLTIMVGASDNSFERIRPYLERMGKHVVKVGPTGQGQALKVISNMVSALNLMAAAEGIRLGLAAGLTLDALDDVMTHGSAQSFEVTKMADRMRRHDFQPGFSVANRLKDLRLALDLAAALEYQAPLGASGKELFGAHAARGFDSLDESSYVLRWPAIDD